MFSTSTPLIGANTAHGCTTLFSVVQDYGLIVYCLMQVNNGVDLAEVWNMEDGDGMPILNAGKLYCLVQLREL